MSTESLDLFADTPADRPDAADAPPPAPPAGGDEPPMDGDALPLDRYAERA